MYETALQEAMYIIFGEYKPIEQRYTTDEVENVVISQYDGTYYTQTIVPQVNVVEHVEYGFNWFWFAGVVMFGIVLHSVLRMVGGLLKCKI